MLSIPFLASAAYNNVSITSSAVITSGGISMTISGDSSVVASIAVDSGSFTVTLSPGSTINVVSATGRSFGVTIPGSTQALTTCDGSTSTLTLTSPSDAGSSDTITVTPGSDACVIPNTGGGSGGGGGSSSSGSVTTTVPAVSTSTTTVATVATSTDALSAQQAQVASLQATLAGLVAQLAGKGKVTGSGSGFIFTKRLSLGSKSNDVINLQKVLNSDPDTQVASSGAGSQGNETSYFGPATKKAVQKFQVKYSLAVPGGVGYGVFGPKTKAKLAEVSKQKGL